MPGRVEVARRRFYSWLSPEERRGVRILAWVSVVSLVGVTATGVWQFFAHEPNPGWFGYQPGRGMVVGSTPSEGIAELHGIFAMLVAAVALIGGAWFGYKIIHDIPFAALGALAVAFFGLISGSIVRFNVVKLTGLEYEEVGPGYLQLFGSDLEFVATDGYELGPMATRIWTVAHVLTVPVILGMIWFGLTPEGDADR